MLILPAVQVAELRHSVAGRGWPLPAGREYLTTPHHAPGELIRHRLDDDRAIDCLPAEVALPITDDWGASQDGWYYCAGYLTDALIIASVENSQRPSAGMRWCSAGR